MNTLEILTAARAKIADIANWAQGTLAKDAIGTDVEPSDATACQFCALGAVEWAAGQMPRTDLRGCLNATALLEASSGGLYIEVPEVNDGQIQKDDGSFPTSEEAHTDTLAMFDRAIDLAKETT